MANDDEKIKEYRGREPIDTRANDGSNDRHEDEGFFDVEENLNEDEYYSDEYSPAVAAPPGKNLLLIIVLGLIGLYLLYAFFFSEEEITERTPEEPRMPEFSEERKLEPLPNLKPLPIDVPLPPPLPLPETFVRPKQQPKMNLIDVAGDINAGVTSEQRLARMRSNMIIGNGSGARGTANSIFGRDDEENDSVLNSRASSIEASQKKAEIMNNKIIRNEGFNPDIYTGESSNDDPNLSFADSFFTSDRSLPHAKARKLGNLKRMILQGKLIDTVLETPINTEIPGMIRAIISRNVYSENGKHVLVPKGSRLVGTYNSSILRGNKRVNIVWSRIIRPDGIDIMLSSPATDRLGSAGIGGMVDNKYLETFGNALLISAIGIGIGALSDGAFDTQRTTNQSNIGTETTTDATTEAAISAVDLFSNTSQGIVSEFLGTSPSIIVPQGSLIKAFVNRDLLFPKSVVTDLNFFNRRNEQ